MPTVIHSDSQNEEYIARLEALYARATPLSPEERELAALLTLLIEDFESKRYTLRRATPLETLREIVEANGLMQKDLLDVFGQESVVSEVMNGKRGLSQSHVAKLARRFNVSPELFLNY
ncbi:MAG: helix-turn-helix domain-containing protein [Acidobacteriota bacterium]|nr:helix-turn-helix domain-containing protein [Acidobacteriota bacterium]